MNFPWVRHWQRYEYVKRKGYVGGKVVVDLGCGIPFGSYSMADPSYNASEVAKLVFAVDQNHHSLTEFSCANVIIVDGNLYDFCAKVDVCVTIEVFEHMSDPGKFINHLSTICKNLFITTPLAKITGKTRNPDHIAEYSAKDFDGFIKDKFVIIDKKYQTGDMRIVSEAKCQGDSYDYNHIVQMAWCEVKNG